MLMLAKSKNQGKTYVLPVTDIVNVNNQSVSSLKVLTRCWFCAQSSPSSKRDFSSVSLNLAWKRQTPRRPPTKRRRRTVPPPKGAPIRTWRSPSPSDPDPSRGRIAAKTSRRGKRGRDGSPRRRRPPPAPGAIASLTRGKDPVCPSAKKDPYTPPPPVPDGCIPNVIFNPKNM